MIGEVRRFHARKPRILGNHGKLSHVEKRKEIAADRPAGHLLVIGERRDSDAGWHLIRRPLLIERLAVDAVGNRFMMSGRSLMTGRMYGAA